MSYRPATVQGAKCRKDWESTSRLDPDSVPVGELRPETWTRLMVAVMRLPVGPDPGILPGSGP